MTFEPNHVITQADLDVMNAAVRALDPSTQDFKELGRELKRTANNVSRFFREGPSGRNIITRDFIGLKISDILLDGGNAVNMRLQIAMLIAGGTTRTAGTSGDPKTATYMSDTLTSAAKLALQQRIGGEKHFFMAAASTGATVRYENDLWILDTTYNEVADGEYDDDLFNTDWDDYYDDDFDDDIDDWDEEEEE